MRTFFRWLLGALFIFAGIVHLVDPTLFLPIMPPGIPFPLACIVVSGVFELLGGLGLLQPFLKLRRWAGWGLALLLVAVFPANIYMAAAHIQVHGLPKHAWEAWARLPLQPILFALVLWVTPIPKATNSLAAKIP